jgi:hypothetical protein
MSILDQLLDEFTKQIDQYRLLKTYSENCNEIVMYEEAIDELENAVKKLEKLGYQRDFEHI